MCCCWCLIENRRHASSLVRLGPWFCRISLKIDYSAREHSVCIWRVSFLSWAKFKWGRVVFKSFWKLSAVANRLIAWLASWLRIDCLIDWVAPWLIAWLVSFFYNAKLKSLSIWFLTRGFNRRVMTLWFVYQSWKVGLTPCWLFFLVLFYRKKWAPKFRTVKSWQSRHGRSVSSQKRRATPRRREEQPQPRHQPHPRNLNSRLPAVMAESPPPKEEEKTTRRKITSKAPPLSFHFFSYICVSPFTYIHGSWRWWGQLVHQCSGKLPLEVFGIGLCCDGKYVC